MHRIFLDANVLFSAAYRADSGLQQLWKLKNTVLCSSRCALEEARVNLEDEDQRGRLQELAGKIEFCEAQDRPLPRGISLPEKDIPILLAAIEGRADYLLTGDVRHFGGYFSRKIEGVVVMPPADYLKVARHRSRG